MDNFQVQIKNFTDQEKLDLLETLKKLINYFKKINKALKEAKDSVATIP